MYACLHSIALNCLMHQYLVTSSNIMHHNTTQHTTQHYTTLHCVTQQTGGMQKPLPLNQQQLSRAWDVSQRSTAADWNEWLRRLNVDLLKESPSPALRSCSALAQAYTPLARDLFHAAFVSCWHELSEQYQDSLVRLISYCDLFVAIIAPHVHFHVSSSVLSFSIPAFKCKTLYLISIRLLQQLSPLLTPLHFTFITFNCPRFEPCKLLSGQTQSHRKYCRPC